MFNGGDGNDRPLHEGKVEKYKTRGTQNELEIMKLIILENRTLYMKVMHKLRTRKETRGLSAFDELKKENEDKVNSLRDKTKLKK